MFSESLCTYFTRLMTLQYIGKWAFPRAVCPSRIRRRVYHFIRVYRALRCRRIPRFYSRVSLNQRLQFIPACSVWARVTTVYLSLLWACRNLLKFRSVLYNYFGEFLLYSDFVYKRQQFYCAYNNNYNIQLSKWGLVSKTIK